LAGGVGRSRYADRLRLNFFAAAIQARGTVSALGQSLQKTAKAGHSPAIAQQQKYDL
jgi:hypothetical protein